MVHIFKSDGILRETLVFGLIGTDKQGKGTTWRHTLYGLSQLGYKVLGVTFPSYNTVGGMGAEINLSHKQIIEHLPKFGIDTSNWKKSTLGQVYSYPLDRGLAVKTINSFLDEGYIVVTKRSSKATHGAYQKAFNNIDEHVTHSLEPFIPDPIALMNMLPNNLRVEDFNEKGVSVLDDFESQSQDPVAKIQRRYTETPYEVNARYGFHIPYEESPQRLDTVLSGITTILLDESTPYKKVAKLPEKEPQPIYILGSEEPAWDFRTEEGLEHFLNNFTGKDLLKSWFSHPLEKVHSYEELFSIDGKVLEYPMSVKDEIHKVIDTYQDIKSYVSIYDKTSQD